VGVTEKSSQGGPVAALGEKDQEGLVRRRGPSREFQCACLREALGAARVRFWRINNYGRMRRSGY
jgi:hypothetical protein